MDDMQFAKYAADIRDILEETNQEGLENLVRNVVAYAHRHNNSKTNWTAQELFVDVIPDELIAEIFNKEENMEPVLLKHLVARYKMDKMLLDEHPEYKVLLGKRIKQHEKDIVDYVTNDSFHAQLNLLTL